MFSLIFLIKGGQNIDASSSNIKYPNQQNWVERRTEDQKNLTSFCNFPLFISDICLQRDLFFHNVCCKRLKFTANSHTDLVVFFLYLTQTFHVEQDRNSSSAGGTVWITSPSKTGSHDTC